MGRKSEFSDDQVFSWLAQHLVNSPTATVQQVSDGTGVSVGSLYHRYGSLDALFARAWLWAAQLYHERTLWLLSREGSRPALRIAQQILGLASDEPAKAMILFCVPKRVLVRDGVAEDLRAEISTLEATWDEALIGFAERSGFDVERLRLAVRDVPQTIAQRYFPHSEIPQTATDVIRDSCLALLGPVPIDA